MRRRWIPRIGAALVLLLLIGAGLAWLTLRSEWFREKVRARIIQTVEEATGGRAEIGGFRFTWKGLRADVHTFVLHGTEPAGKPPLFRASNIAVGLKIASLWKRDIDIQFLDVLDPRVYLIVRPDGGTNVPEPIIKGRNDRNAVETIVNLAIGRFSLQNGVFEVEKQGATPFGARGQNLNARFIYEPAGPRYRGEISMQPVEVRWPDGPVVPVSTNLALTLEKNRIGVTSARLKTGASELELSGSVADLSAPHGRFQYDARIALADVSRIFRVPELERGTVQTGGSAEWSGGDRLAVNGNVRAFAVDYRDSSIRLRGGSLEGALNAGTGAITVERARLSGTYVTSISRLPVSGRVGRITLHGRNLDLENVALAALGGSFRGEARVTELERYAVSGEVAGVEAKPAVALYSNSPLPWDARAWGPVRLEGSLRNKRALRIAARLTVGPAEGSAPVHGNIQAIYEARTGTLDVGRSTLSLPGSRAGFSGVFGRDLKVHLETRDLNDILPAIDESADSLPVKMENGAATFDGTVTGPLENPVVAGHLDVRGVTFAGRRFDSLAGGVIVTPSRLGVQSAEVRRGPLTAQFAVQVGLSNWKPEQTSPVFGNGHIANARVTDVLDLLNPQGEVAASGELSAEADLRGTIGKPIAHGTATIAAGSIQGEPFDRFTASLDMDNDTLKLTTGSLAAGRKKVTLSASLQHPEGQYDRGRLRFQVETNDMPVDEIRTLEEQRPGIQGTLRVNAGGDLELVPGNAGTGIRIADFRSDISGQRLQLTGQQIGDAHVTARTEGPFLRAHLDANFADSAVRGDGQWRLEGDYPGSATITVSRLDLAELRPWISPEAADQVSGSAEGELRIDGPLMKWDAIKAQLRLPRLEIGPAPSTGVPASFALRNAGPVVATLSNSVVTVESFRMTGRATDVSLSGKANLKNGNPLDLRVNGKIDLATVNDFDPDLTASGMVTAEGTIRGEVSKPQVNGRMQFENAAFSIIDFPNGISKASGTVLFSGDRATIQKLTGETGGGTIDVTGFATYGGGPAVFRFYAEAHQVRVRYPEGVSTVADARLRLTGTIDRSTLSGTITVLRTGFNPQSDFSSLIAKSAEPVQTPAVRMGLLGGMNFDVQVTTSPDIQFESSLTQDLQVEANLKLRGTPTNPAVVGRINITHGQVVFFGTKYNVNQGSISFYNALKVEPILDIDLETKARGIDVTLTVTGPLNKLTLTPRSDPPLQFNEIVALLATGRAPTSDPTLLAQQSTSPQSWQQMGASALLGQAIASPVAGRLQRFFGVSKLRIDPTLPGVEYNPQARLTIEQQVTPDITLTYITNVTGANNQVARLEWSFSKRWSVVMLREENGVFGVDFFYKKSF